MSQEERTFMTLKEIFQILQNNIHAYMQSSDIQAENFIKMRKRRVTASRTEKAASVPNTSVFYHVKDQATSVSLPVSPTGTSHCSNCMKLQTNKTDSIQQPETMIGTKPSDISGCTIGTDPNITTTHASSSLHVANIDPVGKYPPEQNLTVMRENIELKLQMQEVQANIKRLERNNEESYIQTLTVINGILSGVLETQKRTEKLFDKLCGGLESLNPRDIHKDNLNQHKIYKLPNELKEFCFLVRKTVGQDYKQIGKELGLQTEILDHITDEYSEEEECLEHVVLEWCKQEETPSLHALVSACHRINPDILNSKPLEPEKVKILQQNYSMLIDEMLEIPVLPHLISSGLMTLKMQRYILKPDTRDQRIWRLINVLCTRENGFEKLCQALDLSDQQHVSEVLKGAISKSANDLTSKSWNLEDENDSENPTAFGENLSSSCFDSHINNFSRRQSSESGQSCISSTSTASSASIPDSVAILKKISEMINELHLS